MGNNTVNTEKVLFESKGIPYKLRNILLIGGFFLTLVAIVGFVCIMTLPRRDAFNTGIKSDTKVVNGRVITSFSRTRGITDEARKKSIAFWGGVLMIGAACLSSVVAGRKLYFKIYEYHVEGHTGIGCFSKKLNVPIQQIGELSSNERGLTPSLLIRTIYGT
ncbi:MAG: hypothetical protein HFH72_11900 [Lachnospiraceae bacterium]|nr:hypothetical protein [Lachnospiraceae bacterium]